MKRYLAFVLLCAVLSACRNEAPVPGPDTTDAPSTTDAPMTARPVETIGAPVEPPTVAEGTLEVTLAEGYEAVALNLGEAVAVEYAWNTLDDRYALIRATEQSGGQVLYLVELARRAVVDALALSPEEALPEAYLAVEHEASSMPTRLILYALEREGDAYAVSRAAGLAWQDGELSLTPGPFRDPPAMPSSWCYTEPGVNRAVLGGVGQLTVLSRARIAGDKQIAVDPRSVLTMPESTARYTALGFLDDARIVWQAVGMGSPAAHEYGIVDTVTGALTLLPALDGTTITALHGGKIYAADEAGRRWAVDAEGRRLPISLATDFAHVEGLRTLSPVMQALSGLYGFRCTLYAPDFSAKIAEFSTAPTSPAGHAIVGDTLYLYGATLPSLKVKPAEATPTVEQTPIEAGVASDYALRTVALRGNWNSVAFTRLDDAYALLRTTEHRLGGAQVGTLYLLETASGEVVDCYPIPEDRTYAHMLALQPGEYRLFDTAREGDATVVAHAATLTWVGGRLTVTARDPQGMIPTPFAEYYLYDSVRDYTAVGGSNKIRFTANAVMENGRVLREPYQHEISIPTAYPANCLPLAFLDDETLLIEVAPAADYRYAAVRVHTGRVLPLYGLNGLTVAAVHAGQIYALDGDTLRAFDASGTSTTCLRLAPGQDFRHLGDACYVRTPTNEGSAQYTYTIYTPDGSAVRAEFAAAGDSIGLGEAFVTGDNLFADGDDLWLVLHNPPPVVTTVTAFAPTETDAPTLHAWVNAGSSVRGLTVPGEWDEIVTHPLDERYTLIMAYRRV